MDRKFFLKSVGASLLSYTLLPTTPASLFAKAEQTNMFFDISLAQWSLHKAFFDGRMDPINFPKIAKQQFGINAVEYVNQFYKGKARDKKYLRKLKYIAESEGVYNHLIMVDGEGDLGEADSKKRQQAVENHYKWVEAAHYLGCRTIRVNARGQSEYSYEEQKKAAADGLRKLCEFSESYGINIVVENHGGVSSNGKWVLEVMKEVSHPLCGTLPDFGNFDISENESYDPYKGTKEMMPYAKGVSAKSYDFDENGNETSIDYERMLKIAKDTGFRGYVGVEYEGDRLSEPEGIKATKDLLLKMGEEMS